MDKIREVFKVTYKQNDKGEWGYEAIIKGTNLHVIQAFDTLLAAIKDDKDLSVALSTYLLKGILGEEE